MSNNIPIEVKHCPVWDNHHNFIGYHMGVFGPTYDGHTRTLYMSAVVSSKGVTEIAMIHPTIEEAQAEWEAGEPVDLNDEIAKKHGIGKKVREEINERGLLRMKVAS